MARKILIAISIISSVVIIISLFFFFLRSTNSTQHEEAPPDRTIATVPTDSDILLEIAKQYPASIKWTPVTRTTITHWQYGEDYNGTKMALPALQITGTGNIDATVDCGQNCESNLIKQLGWETDHTQAADGPAGSLWGYVREESGKRRIIQATSTDNTVLRGGPMEVQCSCDYIYTFSLSDPF